MASRRNRMRNTSKGILFPYLNLIPSLHHNLFSKLKSNGEVIGKWGFVRVNAARKGWHNASYSLSVRLTPTSTLIRFDASNTSIRLNKSTALGDASGNRFCKGYSSFTSFFHTRGGPKSNFATTSRADCFWMHKRDYPSIISTPTLHHHVVVPIIWWSASIDSLDSFLVKEVADLKALQKYNPMTKYPLPNHKSRMNSIVLAIRYSHTEVQEHGTIE